MRQTAARLNRIWLAVLGLLSLLGGLTVLLISTGLLSPGARALGLTLATPTGSDPLVGSAGDVFGMTGVVVLVAVLGAVVALLGLAWLLAQIPRSSPAKPFRLHDDPETGLTRCAPAVITKAVEAQVEALPGVQAAAVVLRGSSAAPDLTIKVTASDRADLPGLLTTLQNQVAADLAGALEAPLRRLGVQVEVDTVKIRPSQIVVR